MGFLKNLKEQFDPAPAGDDELRADLRACLAELHPSDELTARKRFTSYGQSAEISDGEAILAVLSPVALGGRGLLFLTARRLLFAGEFGRIEIPMHQISISGISVTGTPTLYVEVGPSNQAVHEFGISVVKRESREHFLALLERIVRESDLHQ